MALFPAYSSTNESTSSTNNKNSNNFSLPQETISGIDLSWLKNNSYESNDCEQINNGTQTLGVEDLGIPGPSHKKKKKKKDKKSRIEKKTEHRKRSPTIKIFDNDPFYEDKKQERGNFLVKTLYPPAIPKYEKYNAYFLKHNILLKNIKRSKKKTKRYFTMSSNKGRKAEDEGLTDLAVKEEELTKVTEDFNKRLNNNSSDVDLWLKYINFQDTIFEFERTYKKNIIGGEHVMLERKLAILERALDCNPASEQLLAERLSLWEKVRPADQLAEECSRALVQDPGSLMLWRCLVHATRDSMARCTVPGVLQLYGKAIARISQLRLYQSTIIVEKAVLALMTECGMFLQQAGLWEQLWTMLKMYLGLSLTASGQFEVPHQVDEVKLKEQEDVVMASGMPLNVLWLRVEELRAARHFVPDVHCDSDPQRVVFTDDVADLVQPVISAEMRLSLAVTTGVLLKVPLVPTSHTLLSCLSLNMVPSSISNIEILLPAMAPTFTDCRCIWDAVELLHEPQFVRVEASPQYLEWVVGVLQRCAELLPVAEGVLIHCWLMRLYGLLCRLHSRKLPGVPASVVKQARSHVKQLLKTQLYKDNLLLYTEYALIERDIGDVSKACKVLETTAQMSPPSQPQDDVNYVFLCRHLARCLLAKDFCAEKGHAVRVLVNLVDLQLPPGTDVSEVTVKRSISRYQQLTDSVVSSHSPSASQPVTLAEAMTPQLLPEWVGCHAYLLYLTHSVWEATALLQKHIDMFSHGHGTMGSLWVEQLYELLVDILHLHTVHTRTGFALLRNTLVKALSDFPNNLTLLATLASVETNDRGGGSPMWKLISYFPATSSLARLVLVFIVRHRVSQMSSSGGSYLPSLLRRLTNQDPTARSPLVWRLYLQLVAASDSPADVKQALYKCINACPWVKALYLDGVKFLPQEISEIQDLIIEKELRLHTSPEELEILRD